MSLRFKATRIALVYLAAVCSSRFQIDIALIALVYALFWAAQSLLMGPYWHFRKKLDEEKETFIQADEEGLLYDENNIEVKLKWTYFIAWLDVKDAFLLKVKKRKCIVIPKNGFANQEDMSQFRELAARNIGPK